MEQLGFFGARIFFKFAVFFLNFHFNGDIRPNINVRNVPKSKSVAIYPHECGGYMAIRVGIWRSEWVYGDLRTCVRFHRDI